MKYLAVSILLLHPQTAFALQYELIKTYTAENLFDEFKFFSGQDPTGGFVQFTPFEKSAATGLIGNATGQVYLGVDTTNVYPPGGPGRPSVRLESKLTFSEGLFVLDLSHLPVGCGTWPAFWTVGLGDWPADGEIDIIEGVNDATHNDASLHVAGDCTVSDTVAQTGTWKDTNCNVEHDGNMGCGTKFSDANSLGEAFNQNGGGVYAMEWTSSTVNVWFFPPTFVPASLSTLASFDPSISHPDPSTFGIPSASFSGPCSSSFGEKLFNHTIVIDTTFCGGWAGGSFGKGATKCPTLSGASSVESCVDFVGNHPEAFAEAYWLLNNLRVWQRRAWKLERKRKRRKI
ncbi:glycoside hydrolase family 16 protein [Amniculicola lignicola CBS 123094]|uniref:Glycoside hydrolase family 16 protein n=1 Tax=Amniculicola lignicola CBS 123094 TaxID=1392246 RepID=A0A6A5WFI9_9PLEO|nr:glycoside hydrolase family 16 protein [Amniculicola lignicola CBS 123094]